MTHTLFAVSSSGEPIAYRDRKRGWWALSVVYPLLPFTGIAAHAASGWPGALALPLIAMPALAQGAVADQWKWLTFLVFGAIIAWQPAQLLSQTALPSAAAAGPAESSAAGVTPRRVPRPTASSA